MAERIRVLVFGASGEVGGHLVRQLLEDPRYLKVITVARRPLSIDSSEKLQQIIIKDLSEISELASQVEVDQVFSCLGTKLGDVSSQAEYIRIDKSANIDAARLAQAQGASFVFISSVEAHPWCPVFYGRMKGETEREIQAIGLPKAFAARPSFFIAPNRKQNRPLENAIAKYFSCLNPVLRGPLKKLRAIDTRVVAGNMIALLNNEPLQGGMDFADLSK